MAPKNSKSALLISAPQKTKTAPKKWKTAPKKIENGRKKNKTFPKSLQNRSELTILLITKYRTAMHGESEKIGMIC